MVQRKVSNKLSIQPIQTETEKSHDVTPNPSLQNYDVKIKLADLKSKRMKKSRYIKRSDIDFNLGSPLKTHQVFRQPPTLVTPTPNKPLSGNKQVVEPTTVVTPTKTPSPKKPLSGNKTSPYGSPNYMKGTSSSEARKEKPSVSTTLKLQRVGKSSSFKKVRTLTTKSPSFKHTRTGTHNKNKIVLCENLEAQRATCSSTLKDSKFPSYLKLTPDATEAQGTSAMKVCPYNYCSLNGHRHAVAPPLKSFLSSRRRMLKTQKNVKPGAFAPCKRKLAEIKVIEDDSKMSFVLSSGLEIPEDQKDDFFVEIHVPGHDSAEIDFQDDANLSEMNFSCEEKIDEEFPSTLVHNQVSFECYDDAIDHGMDSDSNVSLYQVFGEISDMEWEEGENTEIHDETVEVGVDKANGDDEREAGIELEKFLAEKLLPYIHDEIMECLLFSDADTVSDTESSMTEDDIEEQIVDNEIICSTELKDESIEEQDGDFSNPFEKVTEASNGELDSIHEPKETDGELDDGLYICKETKDVVMEKENISSETEKENEENVSAEEQISMPDNGSQAEVELSETRNNEDESLSISAESQKPEEQFETEAKKATNETSTNTNQEQNSKVNLHSFEDHAVQVTMLQTEDSNLIEDEAAIPAIRNECQKVYKGISGKGIDSTDELFDSCNKLKGAARCRKSDEENEDAREFNPRPPNFLPLEPEQDAEKVDLRHQDMEERRNAEEWMLDHALQKTVNQLAIARKRKVALLVEAFESVLPIPKYEPQMRRDSSSFSQARRIQACR